jgi:hypothetical protein
MSNSVDIAIQDRLALGFVEANRGANVGVLGAAATALITSRPEEYETKSEGGKRRVSMLAFSGSHSHSGSKLGGGSDVKSESAMDIRAAAVQSSQLSTKFNADTKLPNRAIRRASSYSHGPSDPPPTSTSSPLNSGTPSPLVRAQSHGDSPVGSPPPAPPASAGSKPKRRTSYAVTVPNAEVLVPKFNVPKELPPVDDAPPRGGKHHHHEGRPMLLSDARESTDTGNDTSFSEEQKEGSNLDEKLLKIGMNSNKKEKSCCLIS